MAQRNATKYKAEVHSNILKTRLLVILNSSFMYILRMVKTMTMNISDFILTIKVFNCLIAAPSSHRYRYSIAYYPIRTSFIIYFKIIRNPL